MELRDGGRPPAVAILLTPLVRDLRRELGALTWVVFEDVALDAETTEAGCRAATSARRVAAHVGITAGTAARHPTGRSCQAAASVRWPQATCSS
jgi:hypothetical protein